MRKILLSVLLFFALSGCGIGSRYVTTPDPGKRPFVFDPAAVVRSDNGIRLVARDSGTFYYSRSDRFELRTSKRWGKILTVSGPHFFHQYVLDTVQTLDESVLGKRRDLLAALRAGSAQRTSSSTVNPNDCSPVPVTESRVRKPSCVPGGYSGYSDFTVLGPDGTDGWLPCQNGEDCGWDETLGSFGIGQLNDPVTGLSCYIDFSSSVIYGCSDNQVSVTYTPSYPNLITRYYWYAPNAQQGRPTGRGEMQCAPTPEGNGRFYAWTLIQTKADGPPNLDEGVLSPDTASYWDMYTNAPTGQHQKVSFWQYQPSQPFWKPWKKMKYIAYCEGGQ
jgi:hypothetical protein